MELTLLISKNGYRGANEGQNNYLQLYQALRRSYEDLYKAIQRKDDTFYFVSFSGVGDNFFGCSCLVFSFVLRASFAQQ